MNIVSLPFLLLNIIILFLVVYFILRPYPLKYIYIKKHYGDQQFDLVEPNYKLTIEKYETKIYHIVQSVGKSKTLIIWCHGGAFMQDKVNITNPLFVKIIERVPNCDLLTFTYPTLFGHSVGDTLKFHHTLFTWISMNICLPMDYQGIHLCGDSAGAWFASMIANIQSGPSVIGNVNDLFQHIPTLPPILSLSALFGWYGTNIKNNDANEDPLDESFTFQSEIVKNKSSLFLDWLWNIYAIRTFPPKSNKFTIKNLVNNTLPILIQSSKKDELLPYNRQFAQDNPLATFTIYDCFYCDHDFIFDRNFNFPELEEAINEISSFLLEHAIN